MSMSQYNMIHHSLMLFTLYKNIDLDLDLDKCGYTQEEETHRPRSQSRIWLERSPSRPDHDPTSKGSVIYRSSLPSFSTQPRQGPGGPSMRPIMSTWTTTTLVIPRSLQLVVVGSMRGSETGLWMLRDNLQNILPPTDKYSQKTSSKC